MESVYKLADNIELEDHDGKTFRRVHAEEVFPTIFGADFAGAVFGRGVMGGISNVTFVKCDFTLAMFETSILFRDCRFIECIFNKTIFTRTTFVNTSFTGSDFTDCTLDGVVLQHGCSFDKVCFTEGTCVCDLSSMTTRFIESSFRCGFYECDGFFDTFYLYDNQIIDCTVERKGFDKISNRIPSEGSFVGWKAGVVYCDYRCSNELITRKRKMCLIKLRVPEDAKRVCAIHKCRASKVEVLEITDLETGEELPMATAPLYPFDYYKGQTYECPEFDEDQWTICAPGFHFFLDKRDAIAWLKYN